MEKIKKTIVIKLGRSIVTNDDNTFNVKRFSTLAKEIKELHKKDIGVVLVVSGAVICGDTGQTKKQAHKGFLASLGQVALSSQITSVFAKQNMLCGQMLLTKSDLRSKNKIQQIRDVVAEAVNNKVVLVCNENDAVELSSFSGNDFLAAKLAKILKSHSLLLLTDVEGVLDKNLRLLSTITKSELKKIATIKKANKRGHVGGMKAKIKAAFIAAEVGISSIIAHGGIDNILTSIFIHNEKFGTKIL